MIIFDQFFFVAIYSSDLGDELVPLLEGTNLKCVTTVNICVLISLCVVFTCLLYCSHSSFDTIYVLLPYIGFW